MNLTAKQQLTGLLKHVEQQKAEKLERKDKLMKLVVDMPDASREDLMAIMEISEGSLRRYLTELYNEGRLPQKTWDHYRSEGRLVQRTRLQRARQARKGYLQLLIETFPDITPLKIMADLSILRLKTIVTYMNELDEEGRLPEGALEAFTGRYKTHTKRERTTRKNRIKFLKSLGPEKRMEHVLTMMRLDPTITVKAQARQLYVSKTTVSRARAELHRQGFISGRAPKLYVSPSKTAAKRELKMREMLKLIKANSSLSFYELARRIEVSAHAAGTHIRLLRDRGILSEEIASKYVGSKLTPRELRHTKVLDGVARDLSMKEIAASIKTHHGVISRDIEAMRKIGDPELLEAEKQRDARRALIPLTAQEKGMKKMFKAIGRTPEDLRADYLDWMENAGPDDLLRSPKTPTSE